MHEVIKKYYAERAGEDEWANIADHLREEREEIGERLAEVLSGHKVLELACGLGDWTQLYAYDAEQVLATDVHDQIVDIAKTRLSDFENVHFAQVDAMDLPAQFDFTPTAVFAGFYSSHFKREEFHKIIDSWRAHLGKGTVLVLIDHNYVDGQSITVARTDSENNLFHFVESPTGERYEMLTNYPSDSYLRKKLANSCREIRTKRTEHYWILTAVFK
jgi:ubiquinone/menaquinone biosynthesis C-methylase UbiE